MIFDRITSKTRYADEFSKNKGIMELHGKFSALLQCLMAVKLFVKKVLTEK